MNEENTRCLYQQEKGQMHQPVGGKGPFNRRRSTPAPDRANTQWSLGLSHDAFTNGRRFRVLAVVDDYTRECLALVPHTSLSGLQVARELDAICRRGIPRIIVSANGNFLTLMAISEWFEQTGINLLFLPPRPFAQDAFVKGFIRRFRQACLDGTRFSTLNEVHSAIKTWKKEYHAHLKRSALRNTAPTEPPEPDAYPGQEFLKSSGLASMTRLPWLPPRTAKSSRNGG